MKLPVNGQLPPLKEAYQPTLVERVKAPTPKFFRTLRTIGLAVAGVAGVIFASPVALPVILVQAAGYMAVAGAVMTTVSQTAIPDDH
jgi:hypothetical protein